jgi:ATP-binding cassette subfamily F protein 3
MLEPVNLLVLDEPTNHLDIRSKEVLKNALKRYDGTLVVISHDRDFLDGLVEEMYEFKEGKVKQFLGGVYDFLKSKKVDSIREFEQKDKVVTKAEKSVSENKWSFEEKKQLEKDIKRVQNKINNLEKEIENLENNLEDLSIKLMNQGTYSDDLLVQYNHAKVALEKALNEWEENQMKEEELKGKLD